MSHKTAVTDLVTHTVTNQPPPLEDFNAFESDFALREAVEREGAAWAIQRLRQFGRVAGSAEMLQQGQLANRNPPQLKCFDRFGRRIDEVEYHPAYHALMEQAIAREIHSIAWTEPAGGHVAHAGLLYLLSQAEPGVCCPVSMTYAAVPALRCDADLAGLWVPRILSRQYDSRYMPANVKTGITIGMAMTEKQGGSDVRANTTQALPVAGPVNGKEYLLTGHKWFCSAPMSDAFLTLAQTRGGLSCFLLPRWRPDGSRNTFLIQRLKDKLGNRANASSEVEYRDTWAQRLGEEGQGVQTIIEMVNHTRLDTAVAAASLMRQAVALAIHHCRHRKAFSCLLSEQPLMQNVLADMALESEAATALAMRTARAFDDAASDEGKKGLARLLAAITKFWLNKRTPNLVYEAMECHGGSGYVEESLMPRLYREAPLNSIWEGSGNVISLDVLRLISKSPELSDVLLAEIEPAANTEPALKVYVDQLARLMMASKDELTVNARRVVEMLAIALQASLLIQFAPGELADGFCRSRLSNDWGRSYGTLPVSINLKKIIDRHTVELNS